MPTLPPAIDPDIQLMTGIHVMSTMQGVKVFTVHYSNGYTVTSAPDPPEWYQGWIAPAFTNIGIEMLGPIPYQHYL